MIRWRKGATGYMVSPLEGVVFCGDFIRNRRFMGTLVPTFRHPSGYVMVCARAYLHGNRADAENHAGAIAALYAAESEGDS